MTVTIESAILHTMAAAAMLAYGLLLADMARAIWRSRK